MYSIQLNGMFTIIDADSISINKQGQTILRNGNKIVAIAPKEALVCVAPDISVTPKYPLSKEIKPDKITKNVTKKERKCPKCGSMYIPTGNRQLYCSEECGKKKKYPTKVDFIPEKPDIKFTNLEYTPKEAFPTENPYSAINDINNKTGR